MKIYFPPYIRQNTKKCTANMIKLLSIKTIEKLLFGQPKIRGGGGVIKDD